MEGWHNCTFSADQVSKDRPKQHLVMLVKALSDQEQARWGHDTDASSSSAGGRRSFGHIIWCGGSESQAGFQCWQQSGWYAFSFNASGIQSLILSPPANLVTGGSIVNIVHVIELEQTPSFFHVTHKQVQHL